MQNSVLKGGKNRNVILFIAAFAAVYILWGSTYLAIKYAIETLPTFLMAGSRFLIAGAILFVAARFTKDYEKPTWAQWKTSFIVGTLLLLGGNGAVVLAEHYVSSSLAALLVATEPFWIVLLSWLWLKGARPNWKVALGLLIGFVGVYLLVGGQGGDSADNSNQLYGTILIIIGTICWATGSLYGLRAPVSKSSILASGMQMLAGGSVLFVVGTFAGEWTNFNIAAVSRNSWLGLAYLTIFGSIIAFTAYSWLLKNAEPSIVATYAYVNPVIAVFLGWLIAGESFTIQMLIGAAVIVGSVILITSPDKTTSNSEEMFEIHTSNVSTENPKALSASA